MTVAEARDEILSTFTDAWEAGPPSQGVMVLYPDVGAQEPPDSGPWVRVSVQHSTGYQATLRGAQGERRYEHEGFFTAELYTPRGDGQTLSDALAEVVKGAFEEVTVGEVTYKNVRVMEVGDEGQWFHANVLADFNYDEVR